MDFMMDVLIIGFGLYLIYCAVKMKRTGELTKGVIIRKDADLTKAPDVPGFIRYMYAKVIAIGICTCICGTLGIINDTYMQLGMMYLGVIGVFVVAIGIFAFVTVKAQKKYLGI